MCIRDSNEPTIDRAYTAFADSLYSAHQALASHPENSQCTQFADSIAAYTHAFENYTFDNKNDITNAAKQLGILIQQFLSEELPLSLIHILLTSLFFTFAYIMVSAIVPDHFCLSLFMLLLTIYILASFETTPIQQAILYTITAGITLTRCV